MYPAPLLLGQATQMELFLNQLTSGPPVDPAGSTVSGANPVSVKEDRSPNVSTQRGAPAIVSPLTVA